MYMKMQMKSEAHRGFWGPGQIPHWGRNPQTKMKTTRK